jgi:dCTP deaminase
LRAERLDAIIRPDGEAIRERRIGRVDLLTETGSKLHRKEGILPDQEIRELIRFGKIRSSVEISEDQIQPASIDLRLSDKVYRLQAAFLPSITSLAGPKIKKLAVEEIDLSRPAVLAPGSVYIARTIENLALPPDIEAKANPKSTTGRLDVFTRLITERQQIFEDVPKGYQGDLYVEIFPRTFPIIVRSGTKLNQLRFYRGNPKSDDEQLRKLAQKRPLVYGNRGVPSKPIIRGGLRILLDLSGGEGDVVAYKGKKTETPIDLARVGTYNLEEFWQPFYARDLGGSLVLHPGEFYLLASTERVSIPPDYAAEMESYDASIGEFTVHYAGFFDPGFGYGESGEIKGTNAVLEVRAHEMPILLEDGLEIGRLIYHKMADRPDKVYGTGIGSSYQQQHLALSKQFKKADGAAIESPAKLHRFATPI